MPSTFSPNLRLELIATGEQSNTWGITTNNNLGTLLEQSISGLVEIDVTAGDVTLTALNGESDQSRNMMLKITGTPGTPRTITVPEVTKLYVVNNTSNDEVTVVSSASGSTGITLKSLSSNVLACDGTDVIRAIYGASDPGTPIFSSVSPLSGGSVNPLLVYPGTVISTFSYTPISSASRIKMAVSLNFTHSYGLGGGVSVPFNPYECFFGFFETTSGSSVLIGTLGMTGAFPNYDATSGSYIVFTNGNMYGVQSVANAALTSRTFTIRAYRSGVLSGPAVSISNAFVEITEIQN